MQTSNRTLSPKEANNKAVVLAFYEALCGRWDFEAASQHLGATYRQHNPRVADGPAGLKAWVDHRPPFASQIVPHIKRVLVDDDFVCLHVYNTAPEQPAMVITEIFRLEDGKIVEHWDVLMREPAESLHGNGIA